MIQSLIFKVRKQFTADVCEAYTVELSISNSPNKKSTPILNIKLMTEICANRNNTQ